MKHYLENTKYLAKKVFYLAKNLIKNISILSKNSNEIIDVFENDIISYNDFGIHLMGGESTSGRKSNLIDIYKSVQLSLQITKEKILKTINIISDYSSLKSEVANIIIGDKIAVDIQAAMNMFAFEKFPVSVFESMDSKLKFNHKDDYRNFFKIIENKSFLTDINSEFNKYHTKNRIIKAEEALENYIDSNDISNLLRFLSEEIAIFNLKLFSHEDLMEDYRATLNYKIMEVYDTIMIQRLKKEERKTRDRQRNSSEKDENKQINSVMTQDIIDKLHDKNILKTEFDDYVDDIIEHIISDFDTQKGKNELRRRITRRFQQAYKNKKEAPINELAEKFGINISTELYSLISQGYDLGYFIKDSLSLDQNIQSSINQYDKKDNSHTENSDENVELQKINLDKIITELEENFEFEDLKKFKESFVKLFVYTNDWEIKTKKLHFQVILDRRESRGNGIFVLRVNAGGAAHRLVRKGKKIVRLMSHSEYEKYLNQ